MPTTTPPPIAPDSPRATAASAAAAADIASAPHPGVSPAGPESIDAAPDDATDETRLALAKMRLIDAARQFAPLQPLRDHPWTTVGVAAGLGAVLGSATGGGATHGLSQLIRSISGLLATLSKVITPIAGIIGPMIAGKVAAATTKDDAAEAVQNVHETGDANVSAEDVAAGA